MNILVGSLFSSTVTSPANRRHAIIQYWVCRLGLGVKKRKGVTVEASLFLQPGYCMACRLRDEQTFNDCFLSTYS